jgi:hypothetical protein
LTGFFGSSVPRRQVARLKIIRNATANAMTAKISRKVSLLT